MKIFTPAFLMFLVFAQSAHAGWINKWTVTQSTLMNGVPVNLNPELIKPGQCDYRIKQTLAPIPYASTTTFSPLLAGVKSVFQGQKYTSLHFVDINAYLMYSGAPVTNAYIHLSFGASTGPALLLSPEINSSGSESTFVIQSGMSSPTNFNPNLTFVLQERCSD